jgi:hypothetical protein
MAVVFDQPTVDGATVVSGSSVTSLTSPSLTITSASNRAGLVCLSFSSNGSSTIIGSIGGVSGTLVAGSDSGTTVSQRSLQISVIAPPSGSQTGVASWTGSAGVTLAIITASGVDQATPSINGTFITGATPSPSLTITSVAGNLTVDTVAVSTGTLSSPNQTEKWNDTVSNVGAGSVGPGTGTTTHTWVENIGGWAQSGSDFLAAGGAASAPRSRTRLYVMP